MKTLHPRVMLLAVVVAVLALTLCVGAHADISTSTPVFTWNTPDTGTPTNYKLYCDGAPMTAPTAVVAASTLTWTALATTFAPGSHACFVAWFSPSSGGFNSRTNNVSFVIPPAAVVVPPPVPFILTVQ